MNADELFATALECGDAAERAALLDRECAGNAPLRAEVESLLAAHDRAGGFLAADKMIPERLPVVALEQAGDWIDRYRLREQIGEGGFGTVWLAEQEEPVRRRVALKIIKLGMDTRQVVARFEAERQALALMDHPNIARVYDGGSTGNGRPYFVMELVRGEAITKFCDARKLTTRERFELFIEVCYAVQHAHQKGIIHRDLKPSNILVTEQDGRPVPKVIDFGIAKALENRLTNKTVFTRFQQFLGTPAYVSPEQAGTTVLDVDTRSDVYSLGVLLYELVTGRTPITEEELRRASLDEMCRLIRERDAVSPSLALTRLGQAELSSAAEQRRAASDSLPRELRGEIDWIVLKALEKNRARRYQSVGALMDDLKRYLQNRPVEARPPSMSYLIGKFVQRHWLRVTFALSLVGTLLVTGIISTSLAVSLGVRTRELEGALARAQREHDKAEEAEHAATEKLWEALLAEAKARRLTGQPGQRFASLAAIRDAARIRPEAILRDEAIACFAAPDLLAGGELPGLVTSNLRVFSEARLRSLIIEQPDGSLLFREPETDREVWRIAPPPGGSLLNLRLSLDGRWLAVAYRLEQPASGRVLHLWQLEERRLAHRLDQMLGGHDYAFRRDGRQFVGTRHDGTVYLVNLDDAEAKPKVLTLTIPVTTVALAGDGRHLAAASGVRKAVGWYDLADGHQVWTQPLPHAVYSLALSPDDQIVGAGAEDGKTHLLRTPRGDFLDPLIGHEHLVIMVHFLDRDGWLMSSSWDGTTRLWNWRSAREQLRWEPALPLPVEAEQPFVISEGLGLRRAQVTLGPQMRVLPELADRPTPCRLQFSPDGEHLYTSSADRVSVWALRSWQRVATWQATGDVHAAWLDASTLLLSDGTGVHRWSVLAEGRPASVILVPGLHSHVAADPNGARFVARNQSGKLVVYDAATGAIHHQLPLPRSEGRIDFSPRGRWFAESTWHSPVVRVLDTSNWSIATEVTPSDKSAVTAFSPDEKRLLISSGSEFTLFECDTWQKLITVRRRKADPIPGPAGFSADSQLLAVATSRRATEILDGRTLGHILTIDSPNDDAINMLAFSPDGRHLAAGTARSQARIWDVAATRAGLKELGLELTDAPAGPGPAASPAK